MIAWSDAIIVLVAVCMSIAFPRMPHAVRCHPLTKLTILVFVVLLCHCVPSYGVVLALLLVVSSVPCLQPALQVHVPGDGATPAETFANPVESFASEPASKSLARMQARDIANKMDIFTQINRKRDKFKQEMAGIQKDLAGVKEFYVNAAKGDPRRKKRGKDAKK